MTWPFEVYVIIRCDICWKFLCMLFWRIYGRRDIYFL